MKAQIQVEEQNGLLIQQYHMTMFNQLSYYIESEGQSIVINPMRDIQQYLDISQQRNAKINYILLTHIPCDHISGHLQLAKTTSAQIILSNQQKDCLFNAKLVEDNEIISFGQHQIKVLITPGHTFESACYLLQQKQQQDDVDFKSIALFTGNTLLLGDITPSDLTIVKTIEDRNNLASLYYESINSKIIPLINENNDIIVYPGHNQGFRLCGKSTKSGLKGTLNNEKQQNKFLQGNLSKEEFIQELLQVQQQQSQTQDQLENEKQQLLPFSYNYISELNRQLKDSDILEQYEKESKKQLNIQEVLELQKNGSIIIDSRDASEFLKGHIKGSMNMVLSTKMELWMGMLFQPKNNTTFVIIAGQGKEEETLTRISRIGYDSCVKGILQGGFLEYSQSGLYPIESIPNIDAQTFKNDVLDLHPLGIQSLDVRDESEFKSGHIQNSINIPISQIAKRFQNHNNSLFQQDQSVYVFCGGGGRALIGCSMLKAHEYNQVVHVSGGMPKIKESGATILYD